MARALQALLLGLALCLGGLACAAGAAAETRAAAAEPSAPSRQMMVMLHLPPSHFSASPNYGGSYGDRLGHSGRRRIAARIAKQYGLTLVSDWPMPLAGVDCFIMSVPEGRSVAEAAAQVSREKAVAWAEPIETYYARGHASAHNDPLFPLQTSATAWRLADLHEIATGRNVRVAVIDSLVDAAHPDLAGQIQFAENFNPIPATGPEVHGTAVAGVIAARADNAKGIVGVAPGARLMALRACAEARSAQGVSTSCDSLSLAKALIFAIDHRAEVVNLSLSGPATPLLGRLLDAALLRGAVVVGAFDENLADGGFPASHPGVIAVATKPAATARSVYVALGRDVLTTQPGGGWGLADGSSYAAAHVSGLFALVRERGSPPRDGLALASLQTRVVDPCASLLRASGPCDCACARSVAPAAARL